MKKVIFWLIVAIICIAVFIVWRAMQQPAVGTIRMGELPKKTADEFDVKSGWKSLQGEYIHLSYPATYREASHEVNKDGIVRESVFLVSSDVESIKVSIIVEKRTDPGFEASPSFQMRTKDVETYERQPLVWQGLDGVLFVKNSSVFEHSAFFRRDEYLLSVATTSPLRPDNLKAALDTILDHLSWPSE